MASTMKSAPQAVAADSAERGGQYLIFALGGESYAIGILAIKEIMEYGTLTEVPMMPTVVRGVINLRGAVVPVIDLSARFGRSPTVVAKRTCIVIVELLHDGEREDVGVLVDTVTEVLDIAQSNIEPPPSFGTRLRSDFISGMGKVAEKFVIILDVDRVLTLEEFGDARESSPMVLEAEALV